MNQSKQNELEEILKPHGRITKAAIGLGAVTMLGVGAYTSLNFIAHVGEVYSAYQDITDQQQEQAPKPDFADNPKQQVITVSSEAP